MRQEAVPAMLAKEPSHGYEVRLRQALGPVGEWSLHEVGQTLVIVTHDERIAAIADRLISMRDGAFVDETRLTGRTRGDPSALAGLGG